MKIDHLVMNIDKKYQTDKNEIQKIRNSGLQYEPSWGKGTRGFKASNIWIGNEYFEMINILKKDGGGWKQEWVDLYNFGHKGLICLMLDVKNIDNLYKELNNNNICVSEPKTLEFKWMFNLLTRRMPWKNMYLDMFEGVPFQIGFQQMDNEKARSFMQQYMVPNSTDNQINGISKVIISGCFSENDFLLIEKIFKVKRSNDTIAISLDSAQEIVLKKSNNFNVEIYTVCNNEKFSSNEVIIENCTISNCVKANTKMAL